jgi:uncharacterized protein (TIGR02996 family)
MAPDDPFLRSIIEEPDDDAPRLVYADWLTERGDPRGDFIRVQCQLACLPGDDPRRPNLEARAHELLDAHREEWCRPLSDLGVHYLLEAQYLPGPERFPRGFLEWVSLSARIFHERGEALFRMAPAIRRATLCEARGEVAALVQSPWLARLAALWVYGSAEDRSSEFNWPNPHYFDGLGDEDAQALAGCPHLSGLTELDLTGNEIGDPGVQALAASPYLTRLKSLTLEAWCISYQGARALCRRGAFPVLTRVAVKGGARVPRSGSVWRTLRARFKDGLVLYDK